MKYFTKTNFDPLGRMKNKVFVLLLKDQFLREDLLTIYNEIFLFFHPFTPYTRPGNLGLLLTEAHSQLHRVINRFFDNIGYFHFNHKMKTLYSPVEIDMEKTKLSGRMTTRGNQYDIESKPLCYKIEQFLYQLENAMIFLSRIEHACYPLLKRLGDTTNKMHSLYFIACWDKWLRFVDHDILWRVFQLETALFFHEFKNFWKYIFVHGKEVSGVFPFQKMISYDSIYQITQDTTLFYTEISPIHFFYKIAKETKNTRKFVQMIYLCLRKECKVPKKGNAFDYKQQKINNLIRLNGYLHYFEDKGKFSFKKAVKVFIKELFKDQSEDYILENLIQYKSKSGFAFISLIIVLDLQHLFAQKLLSVDYYREIKIQSGVYLTIIDMIDRCKNHFQDEVFPYNEYTEKTSPEKKICQTLNGFMRMFERYLRFHYLVKRTTEIKDEIEILKEMEIHLKNQYNNNEPFAFALASLVGKVIQSSFVIKEKQFEDPNYLISVNRTKRSKSEKDAIHSVLILDKKAKLDCFIDEVVDIFSEITTVSTFFARQLTSLMIKDVVCYKLDARVVKYTIYGFILKDRHVSDYKLGVADFLHRYAEYEAFDSHYVYKYDNGFIKQARPNFKYFQKNAKFEEMYKAPKLIKYHNYTFSRFLSKEIRIFNGFLKPFKPNTGFVPNFRIQERLDDILLCLKPNHKLEFNFEQAEMEIQFEGLCFYGNMMSASVLCDLIDLLYDRKNDLEYTQSEFPELIYQIVIENKCRTYEDDENLIMAALMDLDEIGVLEYGELSELEKNGRMPSHPEVLEQKADELCEIEFEYGKKQLYLRIYKMERMEYSYMPYFYEKPFSLESVDPKSDIRIEDVLKCKLLKELKGKKSCELTAFKQKMVKKLKQSEKMIGNIIDDLSKTGFFNLKDNYLHYVP